MIANTLREIGVEQMISTILTPNIKFQTSNASFELLRTKINGLYQYYFVDKTQIIQEIIDGGPNIMFFMRPRRFGKSLVLNMLRSFFEHRNDNSSFKHLFENSKIYDMKDNNGKQCMYEQGQYPVIYLDFSHATFTTYEQMILQFKDIVATEYSRHYYLAQSSKLNTMQLELFNKIMRSEENDVELSASIKNLVIFLNQHTGKKVVVLIDEYDSPMQIAYETDQDFAVKMCQFIKALVSNALKTNHGTIKFGIMCGCQRSMSAYSGFNNIQCYTVLSQKYNQYFGFTQSEAICMINYVIKSQRTDLDSDQQLNFLCQCYITIDEWYNGYKFCNQKIFNPFSVLNCMLQFQDNKYQFIEGQPFWKQTSKNIILKKIISSYENQNQMTELMEQLLDCKSIKTHFLKNWFLRMVCFLCLKNYFTRSCPLWYIMAILQQSLSNVIK
ncbi:Conserved_hypothetical protein [Hexamita inflata]|uniref:AAA-ATPase-like domain-containing protein n=1 Tax=Hexamita inflata TaxID=28002 RepID=A0AA86UQQ2_9EUKA|nr:Conserved hypothetical protein [Hexamita inflata]